MQKTLYQSAIAGDTLSASLCRSLSIRQRMHETLYQTAEERLLHPLSDRVCPASAV